MQWILVIISLLCCTLHSALPEPEDQDDFEWAKEIFRDDDDQWKTAKQDDDYECPDCVCGLPNTEVTRIVAGNEAPKGRYPWMTLLQFHTHNDTIVCGGSLINDLYILTAGHCIKTVKRNITVTLGVHDALDKNGIKRKVSQIIKHEKYDSYNLNNDITLLKLDKRINLTNGRLWPVCIAHNHSFDKKTGRVTGWGFLSQKGPLSRKLQQTDLPVVPEHDCKKVYGQRLTKNMICAGHTNRRQSACFGDSGGPLMYYNKTIDAYQQFGLVSWGIECGKAGIPTIFAKMGNYLHWIRTKTRDACYCNEPEKIKY